MPGLASTIATVPSSWVGRDGRVCLPPASRIHHFTVFVGRSSNHSGELYPRARTSLEMGDYGACIDRRCSPRQDSHH